MPKTTQPQSPSAAWLSGPPVNPKTGCPYSRTSKKHSDWFNGLKESEKNIIADFEAH